MIFASIPRSGSTYLFRCLAGLPQGDTTPPNPRQKYGIYKTHRQPQDIGLADSERIFLFGDPILAVISTKKHRYEPNHFKNCGADWPPMADIYEEDILGYEALFDAWTAEPGTLCLRYETLSHHRQQVDDYLGRHVRWLPMRERTTTQFEVSADTLLQIETTYADLITAVQEAPDAWIV